MNVIKYAAVLHGRYQMSIKIDPQA